MIFKPIDDIGKMEILMPKRAIFKREGEPKGDFQQKVDIGEMAMFVFKGPYFSRSAIGIYR